MLGAVSDIQVIELTELPIEYALTIISPDNLINITELEYFYKDVAKGNLYKLYSAKNEVQNFIDDPILLKISKLSYAEKLILAVICLHDGDISNNILNEIIEHISFKFFIPPKFSDVYAELVQETGARLRIAHASIIDSFQLTTENHAALTAYKFLVEYYEEKSKNNDYISDENMILLRLYSLFEPQKLLSNLQILQKILMTSVSEAQGLKLLKKIFESIPKSASTEVKLRLVNIAYSVGFYNGAYDILTSFSSEGETYLLLKCMLLNRIDRHNEVFEICADLLKKRKKYSIRFELIMKMIQMLSERSVNNSRAYNKIFNELYNNKKYKNIYEYGFLLRNSQIVLSYSECLPVLEESMRFFQNRQADKDVACTELAYLIQQSRLGNIGEGHNRLEKIKNVLLNSTFEKHIILLNQAAIKLLNEEADDQTLILLEESMLSATTIFDKVIIQLNRLCWFIANKVPLRLFINLKEQIDALLISEPDLRLHCRAYINYSSYYRNVINDIAQTQLWLDMAKTKQVDDDELCRSFIENDNPKGLGIMRNRPYYISFITYWHFEIPML